MADQAELPGVDQAIPDVAGMWDYPGGSESTTPARPDHGWLRRWPLRSYLELGALDTAPGSARARAGAVLREWELGDIEDDACVIVSELVTNAVLSTRAARLPDPVRLWMLGSEAGALLLVWDATMPAPVRRAAAPDAEHGRGLNSWTRCRPAGAATTPAGASAGKSCGRSRDPAGPSGASRYSPWPAGTGR